MNRTTTILAVLLLIQGALAAAVYWPRVATTDRTQAEPLAPFDRDLVDEIYIGDEYDNETVLLKSGDRWLLPELENLPADTAMVDRLLSATTDGKTGWPIADSIAARQRFQVASYYYRRRIRFLQDYQVLGTLYLGSSPAFRKIHARNDEQSAIYSIDFSDFEAPGINGAWLDRKLLQIRTPLAITADGYSLRRQGSEWRSGIGGTPDERELQALLAALRSLQIDGVASEDSQRDLAGAEAELILTVQSLTGDISLELFDLDGKYFIYSSRYPLFFRLSAYDHDRLTNIDVARISGETADAECGTATPC